MLTYIKYRINEFFFGGCEIQIPKNSLVLDVASGGKPYWRSNVLFDKFIMDDTERDGGIVIDRDFVVGDVYHLPFKDKSFDFVIARHILEHLEEPELFLKELERVGKAGYIETPSSLSEQLFGWSFHLWFVDVVDGALEIRSIVKNEGLNWLGKMFWNNTNLLKFLRGGRQFFYTSYYWTDKIKYNFKPIADHAPRKIVSLNHGLSEFDLDAYKARRSVKGKIKSVIDKIRRRLVGVKSVDLINMLICIDCGSSLSISSPEKLCCTACAREYEANSNIPVML